MRQVVAGEGGVVASAGDDVIAVYVEATAEETEARLLNGSAETLSSLACEPRFERDAGGAAPGPRHSGRQEGADRSRPVRAMACTPRRKKRTRNWCKPCGSATAGGCSASSWCGMISGWRSTGFMRELEVRLLEGQNSASVDLFDHGSCQQGAGGFWPGFRQTSRKGRRNEQGAKGVLEQAVSGLAQEGKVISVRLALFAEMMKGKRGPRPP